jgi:outer membrane immunogenic protein
LIFLQPKLAAARRSMQDEASVLRLPGEHMRHARSLLLGILAALSIASVVTAADFLGDGSDSYGSLFEFEGFYVGGTVGGATLPDTGIIGTTGVIVGANFELTDALVSGVEFQGDLLWDGGLAGYNTLLLGKFGGYLADDILAYASAGGGFVNGEGSYAFGGGLEMAVAQQLSVRGEALGTGSWGGGPDGAKAAVGVLWHMN